MTDRSAHDGSSAASQGFTELVAEAAKADVTVGAAESITAGLFSHSLASVPGGGDVFRGGIISYQREVKYDLLDVPRGPVVTEDAAIQMATAARSLLGCDLCVALTGVAGPETQDGMPVGTVFVAVADEAGVQCERLAFDGDPRQVRSRAAAAAAAAAAERLRAGRRV